MLAMRILLAALTVVACTDSGEPIEGPDSGVEDGDVVQWVEDGHYEVEWLDGSRSCASAAISNDASRLDWCGAAMEGTPIGTCWRYAGTEANWHVCPNIGRLHGEIRNGIDVLASFSARLH